MRCLICILGVLATVSGFAQNLAGKWTGLLRQDGNPSVTFKMELEISYGFQNVLVGKGKFTRNDGAYVIEHFEGRQQGNGMVITETEVLQSSRNGQWCLKAMTLNFNNREGRRLDTLTGSWYGTRVYENGLYYDLGVNANGKIYNCQPGSLTITRPTPLPERDSAMATTPPPPQPKKRPLDGYYDKKTVAQSRSTPHAPVHEGNAKYVRRIWREFDIHEKFNTYMGAPKSRLIDVLMDGIRSGKLTAYGAEPTKEDPGGDSFTTPLGTAAAIATLADSALVTKSDALGNIISATRVAGEFNPDSITRFRIKEDWVFDAQRSVFEPHIIGIAPLMNPRAVRGLKLDMQPAFWIYFPQLRPLLAARPALNNNNEATGLSFEDVFMKRLFYSHIVKQSNNRDLRIKDYTEGLDKLTEAERIKKSLRDWESELWHP